MQITEKQRTRILQLLYSVGYVLLMIGTILYFSTFKVAPYLFSLGVVCLIVVRVVLPIDQSDFRTKRLNKIHATTHNDPIYTIDGVVHYCVANIPGAVPYTSTLALTNATLPYAIQLANQGWEKACAANAELQKGLNIVHVYHRSFQLPFSISYFAGYYYSQYSHRYLYFGANVSC